MYFAQDMGVEDGLTRSSSSSSRTTSWLSLVPDFPNNLTEENAEECPGRRRSGSVDSSSGTPEFLGRRQSSSLGRSSLLRSGSFKIKGLDGGKPVVLKLMRSHDEFLREISSRGLLDAERRDKGQPSSVINVCLLSHIFSLMFQHRFVFS